MAKFFRPEKKTSRYKNYPVMSVTISRLNDKGQGIANLDSGKTIFVNGALVGEKAEIKITKETSRYLEANVVKLIQSAPMREGPACEYYERCGGCSLQHLKPSLEREFKKQRVLSQLKHWANIEPNHVTEIESDSSYAYRQRIRLGVIINQQRVVIGFRQANSKQLINIDHCPIMTPDLSLLIRPLKQWLSDHLPAVTHIELIDSDQAVGVVIRHTRPLSSTQRDALHLLSNDMETSKVIECWFQGNKQPRLTSMDGEQVDPRLCYTLVDYDLRIFFHPQDFIQANRSVNQRMVKQAVAWLNPGSDEVILDLYCGVGNFTLAIAQSAKKVIGVEVVSQMVSRAQDNANYNKCLNAEFKELDLSLPTSLKQLPKVDAVLLDPPRSGAKAICESIYKLNPKRIVYVSCDTATFARDAQILSSHGYGLLSLSTMEMFPQTPHSEVMGLFSRQAVFEQPASAEH